MFPMSLSQLSLALLVAISLSFFFSVFFFVCAQLVCGKTWTGSAFGGCRGRTQLPKYVQAYLERRPPFVDEFVTAVIPHTEARLCALRSNCKIL